jgi:hypothetical protein
MARLFCLEKTPLSRPSCDAEAFSEGASRAKSEPVPLSRSSHAKAEPSGMAAWITKAEIETQLTNNRARKGSAVLVLHRLNRLSGLNSFDQFRIAATPHACCQCVLALSGFGTVDCEDDRDFLSPDLLSRLHIASGSK